MGRGLKGSGRDEPMWVAIHMCIEAMLGVSLYSCPYLKLAKTPCLSYYLLCFLFNKIRYKSVEQVCLEVRGKRKVAQTMYTHMSKCKNNKIKKKRIVSLTDGQMESANTALLQAVRFKPTCPRR
jgi:hypothetical protein